MMDVYAIDERGIEITELPTFGLDASGRLSIIQRWTILVLRYEDTYDENSDFVDWGEGQSFVRFVTWDDFHSDLDGVISEILDIDVSLLKRARAANIPIFSYYSSVNPEQSEEWVLEDLENNHTN